MKNKTTKRLARALLITAISCIAVSAIAQSTVFGEGRAPIGAGDAAAIRNASKQDAIRDAVIKGIKDATALDASDPIKFGAIVNEVAKQLRNVKVVEERREGSEFVTKIEVVVDRKEVKNAIRGTDLDKANDRSFSLLMMVDEFVTNTRDLKMPLKELVEFNSDKSSSFSDKSLNASASSSQNSAAVAGSSSINAASASSTKVAGSSNSSLAAGQSNAYGSAGLAAQQNSSYGGQASSASALSAKKEFAAASSSKSANSAIDQKNIQESSRDTQSYRKLVEYQDTSKPGANAYFLPTFTENVRNFDLKLLDSAIIRSKFFGDAKITLNALTNGAQMAKFSEFARKANADFLMLGSSTVIEGDKNSSGMVTCVVNAEVKAFATAGSEVIAAKGESMQASGVNIEQCAAVASGKIADKMAPVFASAALNYWADRAARGFEYTVLFKSASKLTVDMKDEFAEAMGEVKGASAAVMKDETANSVKYPVTIKGKPNVGLEISRVLKSKSNFTGKPLDRIVEGQEITLCLDSCAAADAPPPQPPKAAPTPALVKDSKKLK